MARRNEILSLNLDKPAEASWEATEQKEKLSPREEGARIRQETAQRMHQSAQHFGEVGQGLWNGLKRISREGWKSVKSGVSHGVEATKSGVKKGSDAGLDYAFYGAAAAGTGAKKVGRGIEKTAAVVAEAPDRLIDAVGGGLYETSEAAKRAGTFAKEKAVAGGRYAGQKLEQGTLAIGESALAIADYSTDKVRDGYDWTAGKMSDAGNWTNERYTDVKGWAGEQADALKERGHSIKDKFVGKVESAKALYRGWQEKREKKQMASRLEELNKFLDQVPKAKREAQELKACLGLDSDLQRFEQAA